MYTLQQFRSLVRETLDLDERDLSDLLVDSWIREGMERAQGAREWDFYEARFNFDTVADQATYTYAEIEAANADGYEVEEIHSISARDWPLKSMAMRDIDRRSTLESPRVGTPTHWGEWGQVVTLFPRPTASETFWARGLRKPTDFVTAADPAGSHDMPKEFDAVISNWAIGRAYAHQDEPQSAVYYADLSQLRLDELAKRFDEAPLPEDIVMNGGVGAAVLGVPRLPWE